MNYTPDEITDYLEDLAASAARARRQRQQLRIVRPCDIKRPRVKVVPPTPAKLEAARAAKVAALEGVAREQAIERALRRSVRRIRKQSCMAGRP